MEVVNSWSSKLHLHIYSSQIAVLQTLVFSFIHQHVFLLSFALCNVPHVSHQTIVRIDMNTALLLQMRLNDAEYKSSLRIFLQEMITIYAAEEGGVVYDEEEVAKLATRVEEPPDLLASLLQELGGVAEFGPVVVEQEGGLNQEDTLYSLTSSSNCDLFLNMVTQDAEVILSSLPLPSNPIELGFQPPSDPPLPPSPSSEAECGSEGGHNSISFYDSTSQGIESVGERPHLSQTPAVSVTKTSDVNAKVPV